MTSANLAPLDFAVLLENPARDAGGGAPALWDVLSAWLPAPPCGVLVLASRPEGAAERLRDSGYRPLLHEAPAGGPDGPAAAVVIVDHGEIEVTRGLLRAAAAVLPDGATLVTASARPAAPARVRDEMRLLLDEHGFHIVERSETVRPAGTGARTLGAAGNGEIAVTLVHARRDRFAIRGYREGDEAAILAMFATSFGAQRSEEHWRWKFRDDPYGSLRITVVLDRDGSLAAHYAGYPVRFVFPSRTAGEIGAMQIGDTMTSKAVRASGLGKTSVLARMVDDFYERHCVGQLSFNYGFNTGHIRKLGERYLSYRYLSDVTVWQRPLRDRRRRPRRLLARALGYRARAVTATGPEWDGFFARVAPRYGLLVQRDARYLNWRYLGCPDRVHTLVEVRRRGVLVGWGVAAPRGRTVALGDALFEPERAPDAFPVLLNALGRLFPGADTVGGWFPATPEWWVARLRAEGFAPGPEPNALAPGFAFFEPSPTLSDLDRYWYYTMGDSDLF